MQSCIFHAGSFHTEDGGGVTPQQTDCFKATAVETSNLTIRYGIVGKNWMELAQEFVYWWAMLLIVICYVPYSESLGLLALSIAQNSKYNKTQRFGNSICFRLQVRGGGRNLLCWVHQRELTSITEQPMLHSLLPPWP
jgi:hypothetical protein